VRTADPAAARRVLGMEVKGRTAAAVMVAEPVDVESESRVSCVPGPGGGRLPGRRPRRGRHGDRGGRGPAPRGGARVAVEPAEKMTTRRRPGWRKRPARPRRPPTSSYGWGRRWSARTPGSSRWTHWHVPPGPDRRPRRQGHPGRQHPLPAPPWGSGASSPPADPLEAAAAAKGLPYLELDGEGGRHRPRRRPGRVDIPAGIAEPGRVGPVSKVATLTYRLTRELRGTGFSICVVPG
jgi:succinyl-CoA synthetase beta subunit